MKKSIIIVSIVVFFALIVFFGVFFGSRIMITHLGERLVSNYQGLSFDGLNGLKIQFSFENSYGTPDDGLAIKNEFENKVGILQVPYDLEIKFPVDIEDTQSFTKGTYSITYTDWRLGGYDTVVIDSSKGYGLTNDSDFSNYTCFHKYVFFGALLPGKRTNDDKRDDSLWVYISEEAKIITDEHTYNEQITGNMKFKDMLNEYGIDNIDVKKDNLREYDDRPSFR